MRSLAWVMMILLMAGSIPLLDEEAGAGERSVPPTRGNTIVVDINGNGDYSSIQAAIDGAIDGDKIAIWNGTYSEKITINKEIDLIGYGLKTIIINNKTNNFQITHSNVKVESLRIINNETVGIKLDKISNVTIKKCTVECNVKGTTGIYIYESDYVNIENNYISNFGFPIITLRSSEINVSNNKIIGEYNSKIQLSSTKNYFHNNTLMNTSFRLNDFYIMDTLVLPTTNTINSIPIFFAQDKNSIVIDRNYSQILLSRCKSVLIHDIVVKDMYNGMVMYDCDNVILDSVKFVNINEFIIWADYCEKLNFTNVKFINCDEIRIDDSDHFRMTKSSINGMDSAYIDASDIDIIDNTVHNMSRGFELYGGDVRISGNKFFNCSYPIRLPSPQNVIYYNNHIDKCLRGIQIQDLRYIDIFNSIISNSSMVGIDIDIYESIHKDKNSIVENITLRACNKAMSIKYQYLDVKNIKIFNSAIGMDVVSCGNISESYFEKNKIGVLCNGSVGAKIFNNTFEKNKLGISCKDTRENLIFSNEFHNNTVSANSDSSLDNWCKALPIGGNYWDDYNGVDRKSGVGQDKDGSDGFGDTPYSIGKAFDRFPIIIDRVKPIAKINLNSTVNESEEIDLNTNLCWDDNMVVRAIWNISLEKISTIKEGLYVDYDENRPVTMTINLTVIDFAGNVDFDEKTVTVVDNIHPIAVSQGDLLANEGSILWFDAISSSDTNGIVKYEWIFDYKGEAHILEGVNISYLFDEPGVIMATLRVTDPEGHTGEDRFTVTILDNTNPSANAGDDITIKNGELATFMGSLSRDNVIIIEYNWTFEYKGEHVLLQGIEVSYLFDKPGIFEITLEITDNSGHKAFDWLTLTVRDTIKPIPVITGLAIFLENENVKLSGSSSTDNGRIVRYVWIIEDNGTVTVEGIDLDYKVKIRGYHNVSLTVFDEWENSASANLTVNALDSTNPFASAGPDQIVAVGSTVTLDGSKSYDDGTITKYLWSFEYDEQKRTLFEKIATFDFDKPGVYEITLKVSDDSENTGSDTVTITVKGTGVVMGTVKDDNGGILEGALIEILASDGKVYSVKSAPNGQFSLEIPSGSFTWTITKDGYEKITGSGTVTVLGEINLDLTNTPMKKVEKSGPGPILFIVPALVILLLIVGIVVFLMMRKKKVPENPEDPSKEEAIPPTPAEGGAEAGIPTPPPTESEFTQSPPVMEEEVPVDKVEKNMTVDDLLS